MDNQLILYYTQSIKNVFKDKKFVITPTILSEIYNVITSIPSVITISNNNNIPNDGFMSCQRKVVFLTVGHKIPLTPKLTN